MERTMRLAILGAGAIGGYFGGRLVESGEDVTFLVRPERKARLQAHGLRIESVYGDATLPVTARTADEVTAPFDAVILTCKAYDLDAAIDAIRPAVGPGTAVLPLLNGLAHIDRLNRELGTEQVLGGLAKIAVNVTPDGVVKHLNDWRYITFGEQSGQMSQRVLALQSAFERSGAVAAAVPDIFHKMWEKLVHLATIAGMTTVMRASVGEIARTEYGIGVMNRFLDANAEIAAREGFAPAAAFLDEYRKLLADKTGAYTASMLRDLERKGPVEADHIIGFMLRKAQAHGLDTTMHEIAYVHLKAYEERRAAGRL
jgi:2-dehydropantoate 2-reductase